LARVREVPTRPDLTWREVESLLRALGAELKDGRGSRIRVLLHGRRASLHRPHPGKELTRGAVESLRDFLDHLESI
jgi:hypothetical protein